MGRFSLVLALGVLFFCAESGAETLCGNSRQGYYYCRPQVQTYSPPRYSYPLYSYPQYYSQPRYSYPPQTFSFPSSNHVGPSYVTPNVITPQYGTRAINPDPIAQLPGMSETELLDRVSSSLPDLAHDKRLASFFHSHYRRGLAGDPNIIIRNQMITWRQPVEEGRLRDIYTTLPISCNILKRSPGGRYRKFRTYTATFQVSGEINSENEGDPAKHQLYSNSCFTLRPGNVSFTTPGVLERYRTKDSMCLGIYSTDRKDPSSESFYGGGASDFPRIAHMFEDRDLPVSGMSGKPTFTIKQEPHGGSLPNGFTIDSKLTGNDGEETRLICVPGASSGDAA